MRIERWYSPNASRRIHGDEAVKLVIGHTPEGEYDAMVAYCLKSSGRRVSYHTIVNEAGTERAQLVPWNLKAWHAGPYNSLSDGVAAAGFASRFNVRSPQARAFALLIAQRLDARGLPARWARNGGGEGFCRHADVQSDRSDPMSLVKWLVFVPMVKRAHAQLQAAKRRARSVPKRESVREEDWSFGRWYLGIKEYAEFGPRNRKARPKGYPRRVPAEGWRAVRWYVDKGV